ncbi:AAA family ATPase [Arthrobacter psychrolactophilus]
MGLAPAAASADVLGHELGLDTDNVSKWLYESTGPGAAIRAGHYAAAAERYQASCQSPRQDTQARKALERLAQRMSALTAIQSKWQFRPNQLVIIDEASMVSTYQLAALLDQATGAGAKILLVGDPAQLDSIDAGGVLGWLAPHRLRPTAQHGLALHQCLGTHRLPETPHRRHRRHHRVHSP